MMIVTSSLIMESLREYSNPACKLERMVKNGDYIRVVRGIYETDPDTPGQYLAQAIRNPSYLSFEWALAYHGLIPEAVYVYTSATYKTRRSKSYSNHFGDYWYRDVAPNAFPYGTKMITENGYTWWIATPEKAICDELYIKPPVYSQRDLKDMLFEDLRINIDDLMELDFDRIRKLSKMYGCSNVKLFGKVMEKII